MKKIRAKVAPFNKCQQPVDPNPFKVGDLIYIFQQPMEREHKLTPKWHGPFKVLQIPNPFQVVYEDFGREKISHIVFCKNATSIDMQAPPTMDRGVYKSWEKSPASIPAPQRISFGSNMGIDQVFLHVDGQVKEVRHPEQWPTDSLFEEDQHVLITWHCSVGKRPQNSLGDILRRLGCT